MLEWAGESVHGYRCIAAAGHDGLCDSSSREERSEVNIKHIQEGSGVDRYHD